MPRKRKQSLEQLIDAAYAHQDVKQAILDDIRQRGPEHEEKILSGELHLPGEHDAARHVSGFAEQEQARHWAQAQRQGGPRHDVSKEAKAFMAMRQYMGEDE